MDSLENLDNLNSTESVYQKTDESKQAEMETFIRRFIDMINRDNADTMCGLIRPAFVSCDYREQSLVMSYPAQYWEQNPMGRMQGGIQAAMLDFTAACLADYQSRSYALTVSIQVSYLRPGPVSGNLIVEAKSTKAGRSVLHSFIQAWSEDAPGKIIATAVCVYMPGAPIESLPGLTPPSN